MGGAKVRQNPFIATSAHLLPIRLPACSPEELLRQSACAVIDQLYASEQKIKRIEGGSDVQPDTKRFKNTAYKVDVDSGRQARTTTPTPTPEKVNKTKWKLGGGLNERDQLDVLKILSDNNDRFVYSLECQAVRNR